MAQYLGRTIPSARIKYINRSRPCIRPDPIPPPDPTPTVYTPLSITSPTLYRTESESVLTEYPSRLPLQIWPEQPAEND